MRLLILKCLNIGAGEHSTVLPARFAFTQFTRAHSCEIIKMSTRMSTRPLKNIDRKFCTEFQLHSRHVASHNGLLHKISDYTEKRLSKLIESAIDNKRMTELYSLYSDYLEGKVAVAWSRGEPVFTRVTSGM